MNVNKWVKTQVQNTAAGALLSLEDFKLPLTKKIALEKALSELYQAGGLQRITKGLYYKPEQSPFGELPPTTRSLLDKLLILYKDSIAYVTGLPAYTQMGLTTQVSTEYVIASDKPRRMPIVSGATRIRFIPSYVKTPVQDTYLLQILDAIREMDNIPATTPEKSSVLLRLRIKELKREQQAELAQLALNYPPSCRAFVGLILESLGKKRLAQTLAQTLNPSSRYRLKIDKNTFPNYRNWYIR